MECIYVCEAAIDAISLYQLHTSAKESQKAIKESNSFFDDRHIENENCI